MATKDDIIAEIQAVADAIDLPRVLIGTGTPGSYTELAGERMRTGQQWEANANDGGPSPTEVQIEGIANWADSQGISDVGAIYAKLNELITSYNQLLVDYDAGTVPTTAPAITPLP